MGRFHILAVSLLTFLAAVKGQLCPSSCKPPKCSCPRNFYPMKLTDIPQMVYFAFDDVESSISTAYYEKVFNSQRLNPNNCTMKMTLFATGTYSHYGVLGELVAKGHELGVHGMTNSPIRDANAFRDQAIQGRKYISLLSGVSESELSGWRSPGLRTVGDAQPEILHDLHYEYDISIPYARLSHGGMKPWPFTLDYGWPYKCDIPPCPIHAKVPGFWQMPVVSLIDIADRYPCVYMDGCSIPPTNVTETFKYLWNNFMDYYTGNRAPFGLHMHASWFAEPGNFQAINMFLDELVKLQDVYVLSVKQVLDWMKYPVPLSRVHEKPGWSC